MKFYIVKIEAETKWIDDEYPMSDMEIMWTCKAENAIEMYQKLEDFTDDHVNISCWTIAFVFSENLSPEF